MALQVHNTLGNRKEPFVPLEPGKVRMYVCGVTVYDLCHTGHARANVAFDVIVRYLRYSGYDVKYVRNFTDIDDKIIRRANERGTDYLTISRTYIDAFYEDFDRMGLLRPDVEPKATEHMAEHSMCQPGRPAPHGLGQEGSPGLADFHRAKSRGSSLRSSTSMRAPAWSSSTFFPESLQ